MPLIPDRYECAKCGGYDVPFTTSLGSACRCGHSIYGDRDAVDDEAEQDANVND